MDKRTLKRSIENSILENDVDEKFCQLYESIINELNERKYVIGLAQRLSYAKTPIITVSLKKKRNRPTILIAIDNNTISMKFVLREFFDVPLNKLNKLIEDCYYHRNESKIADEYIEEEWIFMQK